MEEFKLTNIKDGEYSLYVHDEKKDKYYDSGIRIIKENNVYYDYITKEAWPSELVEKIDSYIRSENFLNKNLYILKKVK